MNEILVDNWNATVDSDDEVLYGGDLTIRTSAATVLDWLEEFDRDIVFLVTSSPA
jgi:calcineurin-like phosphoesterase family protein